MKIAVPAHFASSLSNQTVVVGSRASIDCHAAGDAPIAIKWARNNEQLDGKGQQRFTVRT